VASTSVGIQPERRLASSGAQPRGDPTGEAAGERWGVAARGLCEQCWLRPAGKNRVAVSGSGERRDRRLGEVVRHSVGHWATAREEVC
jgi:hypothetical protein